MCPMNCMSVNLRGAGGGKAVWVRGLKIKHQINFLSVQETQMIVAEKIRMDYFWDSSDFEHAAVDANGRSGGLFCLWNPRLLKQVNIIKSSNFILVSGKWGGSGIAVNFLNVYAPVCDADRSSLWIQIANLLNSVDGCWLLMGDFNEIRHKCDRFSQRGRVSSINDFNSFIASSNLFEFKLGGRKFTWISEDGRSLSKLDRFFANQDFLEIWGLAAATILPRNKSDHCPIILINDVFDFGPSPFRFFNSWLSIDGIDELVNNAWRHCCPSGTADVRLLRKLKNVKRVLKFWRSESKHKETAEQTRLLDNINDLEVMAETRQLTDQERESRKLCRKRVLEIDAIHRKDLRQKARLKWSVEGDENTRFFHGWINNRKKKNRINGLSIDGVWVDGPEGINDCIFDFFSRKFKEPLLNRPVLISEKFKKLSDADNDLLTATISESEIKLAVWSCCSDKAPGPDGFTFSFFKKYWDLIKSDVCRFVNDFEVSGSLARGCNASFVSLIPKVNDPLYVKDYRPINLVGSLYKILSKVLSIRLKKVLHKIISSEQSAYVGGRSILDGPLLLNEIYVWAKKLKKKILFFKVDFDKAFDSLSWDFLDSVMNQMNFDWKWRRWIRGCLSSAKASVLVNGAPTKEFDISRGVRQGDPLAPFLFIIAMEGLHVSLEKACELHYFRGISFSKENVSLSHLMYADDVTFVGEWSEMNIVNLNRILRCFFLASGLKVNLHKSKVFGVGVTDLEISRLAGILKCESASFPFIYLGLPVGANMKLSKNWSSVIDKFEKRLSSWKAKNLSFGGRLTLVKSVLNSLPLFYFSLFKVPRKVLNTLDGLRRRFLWGGDSSSKKIHWVKWETVVTSKNNGGLGVGCLESANLALLAKWRWRLKTEHNALWSSCIRAIHKLKLIDGKAIARSSLKGVWYEIAGIDMDFERKGVFLDKLFNRKVGIGDRTFFWKDSWCGEVAFKDMFPNLYSKEVDKDCLVANRVTRRGENDLNLNWNWKSHLRNGCETRQFNDLVKALTDFKLGDGADSWCWNGGGDGFSVKHVRELLLNSNGVISPNSNFKWVNWLPLKVNCLVWKVVLDRIPTFDNLAKRNISISSNLCPLCRDSEETTDHLFFCCKEVSVIWDLFGNWSSVLPNKPKSGVDLISLLNDGLRDKKAKKLRLSLVYSLIWSIWIARNGAVFRNQKFSIKHLLDDTCVCSFNWVNARASLLLDWTIWCMSPISALYAS